ncbi:MAG: hypothetical protein R8G66_16970 [Cytophagales bacterium]|nr:hypothetical protein [Cytophagales bacterium]
MIIAKKFQIKKANEIIDQVAEVVNQWLPFAEQAEVGSDSRKTIGKKLEAMLTDI